MQSKQVKSDPAFDAFFHGVKDQLVRSKILARISRMRGGNFGDSAHVGQGVFEARINVGPGFRIYYTNVGDQIVLLLGGGTKNGQQADIDAAIRCAQRLKKKQ